MIQKINLERHVDLSSLHTFKVKAKANYFVRVRQVEDLFHLKPHIQEISPHMVVGEGSNVLFVHDYPGLVIKNEIKGIEKINEDATTVTFCVGAGENWHGLVCKMVSQGLGGMENLSLIPGTTGAAPIQNLGAYGVELKGIFVYLEALELSTFTLKRFYLEDCHFGYRDSVFKRIYKDKLVITQVAFKLTKTPVLNLSYADLEAYFSQGEAVTLRAVSNAVIAIRQKKLPDPSLLPNAGSFFKNPIISRDHLYRLKMGYHRMPYYETEHGKFKLPAAWLIEQCGFKGKRWERVGVHDKQALVIINHQQASGLEIMELANTIRRHVFERFAVQLEYEVNII